MCVGCVYNGYGRKGLIIGSSWTVKSPVRKHSRWRSI